MITRKLALTLGALAVAALPLTASASDTPRGLWIKMKCALCHGEDGAGNTSAGKQTKAADLRTETAQNLKDTDLLKAAVAGHAGMPAIKSDLSRDQAMLLIAYIRGLAPKQK